MWMKVNVEKIVIESIDRIVVKVRGVGEGKVNGNVKGKVVIRIVID